MKNIPTTSFDIPTERRDGTLRTTLYETRDTLHVLRKSLFVRGHIEAMGEIDSLIGIAEDRAVHAIGHLDRAGLRTPTPVVATKPAMPDNDIVVSEALPPKLGELREQGMGLSMHCGNARCGHLRSLDLDGLIDVYGTHYDFTTQTRLASKLVCKRCHTVGGRLIVVADRTPRY